MNEKSYLGRFFEPLFFVLIVLVILQTFSEEFSAFMNYSVTLRKYLLLAGFGFDIAFTAEFIARLCRASRKGGAGKYMTKEYGFIDLIASIPLLLLHSGPLVYLTFFSGKVGFFTSLSALSLMKIIKPIRIARTLRYIRTLKLVGKTKKQYVMTARYISRVLSIVITVIVLSMIGFSYIDSEKAILSRSQEAHTVLSNYIESHEDHKFDKILKDSESVLFIKSGRDVLYRRIDEAVFDDKFMGDDSYKSIVGGYEVTFSNKDSKRTHAFINMLAYSMIIAIIIAIATLYRRFFNRHIAGTIFVMLRGFQSTSYSTPVRIKKNIEFEINQLADQYNRKWLPVKGRIIELKAKKR
ncbi:MAG: hypothetical protein JSV25_14450 [Spirochaetota bacterium]|nr:MAG: hypothetical protein JSV25_14450 [Spirochaetota bacterium]